MTLRPGPERRWYQPRFPGYQLQLQEYSYRQSCQYYIGVIYLKQEQTDLAIEHLGKYKPGTDELKGVTHMLLGHAWADKGDNTKAVAEYKEAGKSAKNDMYSPYYYKMAGDLLLVMEDYSQALDMYKLIRKNIH